MEDGGGSQGRDERRSLRSGRGAKLGVLGDRAAGGRARAGSRTSPLPLPAMALPRPLRPAASPASPFPFALGRARPAPHLVKAKYMRLTMVKLSRVMVCGR